MIINKNSDPIITTRKKTDKATLREQQRALKLEIGPRLIEAVPHAVLVINENREIVLCNKVLMNLFDIEKQDDLLGLRPGELLRCINSHASQGCGENDQCEHCEVLNALTKSFKGKVSNTECSLLTRTQGVLKAITFSLFYSPFKIKEEFYSILYLSDISAQKNKAILEKIFLHDLMNAVNGIIGASSLIQMKQNEISSPELAGMIKERANFIANEIKAHQLFTSADNEELKVEIEQIDTFNMLDSLKTMFSGSPITDGKKIILSKEADAVSISSDKNILYRVLENLIKNAIEASSTDQTVTINCHKENSDIVFEISNENFIPKDDQFKIYKKFFSTKGEGRGLGTYSVKMFAENYLQGTTWFETSAKGTTFFVKIPLIYSLNTPS
ncbi:PAS domain-containing sensor histidine kinase [Maridesulfovibrio frigidus]|uniref:PAS domain-containing sensor histidine kinase n=1 Tax=Maridesulfovibrio frigidus TaxID=340956 RepID=UPI0006915A04|nr:HAMP domain-containing sensor histidine kinase [Maridesulfovibrio frigidus]